MAPPSAASHPALPGLPAPPGADLRRKAHARLAERVDLNRSKFKPLSLLRAEGKRVVDQFLDQEAVALSRPDRDRMAEDVLAEAVGFGPLEELFRDEAVKEVLVLAANQVIARRGDGAWLPTSSRFRDGDQWRQVLARWAEAGDGNALAAAGGVDVRLANGFRVVAVVPPPVMDAAPQACLVRGPAAAGTATPAPAPAAAIRGGVPGGSGGVAGSGVLGRPPARPTATPAPVPAPASPSGTVSPLVVTPAPVGAAQAPAADPHARLRQRVAERIVMKFAAAGVYDLNLIPLPELRRIVVAQVTEFCQQERLSQDDAGVNRLALEILANMSR